MGNDVILGGDFNTPCQSALYHREWSGFSDAFNAAGLGTGHSYFGLGASVRIDHLLSAAGWRCIRCRVGPDVGSPHRPVIADFERTGSE
jgi:endonuclease/exonuclease/phosphatase (EEP) superfamily protein YafD